MLAATAPSVSLSGARRAHGARRGGAALGEAVGKAALASDADARLSALMALAQQGDKAAYRILLDAAQARLVSYFRSRLREDPASADDLAQETLIAIHAKRHTYDPGQPFSPWLFAIARYKLIDHYRRFRLRRTEPEDAADEVGDECGDTRTALARLDLDTLLARLPARQAEAIRRTKLNGQSVSETAGAMQISESLVKVNVHRGIKAAAALVGLNRTNRS